MSRAGNRAVIAAALIVVWVAGATAATDTLPAAVGNKWEYETVRLTRATLSVEGRPLMILNDASSGTSIYEFTSADGGGSPTTFDYVERTELQSAVNANKESERSEIRLTSDESAVRILSTTSKSAADAEPDRQIYEPPLLYFDKNASVGKAWSVGEMRDGEVKSLTTARIVGKETVQVPAGTFENCSKVVYSSDAISGSIEIMKKPFKMTAGKSRGVYWISEGIGVVKELEVLVSTAESPGPNGKPIKMQTAVCSVSELKPGYTVKGSAVNSRRPHRTDD